MIFEEKEPQKLIQRACRILTEGRGYFTAWIALLDEAGRTTAAASAGEVCGTAWMHPALEQGGLPLCGRWALEQPDLLVLENLTDHCVGCSWKPTSGEGGPW